MSYLRGREQRRKGLERTVIQALTGKFKNVGYPRNWQTSEVCQTVAHPTPAPYIAANRSIIRFR